MTHPGINRASGDSRRWWRHVRIALLLGGLFSGAAFHPEPARAGRARDVLRQPDVWFGKAAARQVAENILSWQTKAGGWPKNVDTTQPPAAGSPVGRATFDNGATTDELRVLARCYRVTGDTRFRDAFDHGLDYILTAQYAHGGWPQSYPPGSGYQRHTTFNDNAMVRLLEFVREVADDPNYDFVAAERRAAARDAFARGIACILRCQVRVDGHLTAWCAQHDEVDFRPRPARTFELASLSGGETVGIVRLLMSLEDPSPETIAAVDAACEWLESVKLDGFRLAPRDDPQAPGGRDRELVEDPAAPSLWARFYEIGTNRPIFADRDGVVKYSLAEIGHERRNGYSWWGVSPQQLLRQDYPAWKQRLGR